MKTLNEKLNKLIDFLKIQNKAGTYKTKNGTLKKKVLKNEIKKILEIDKQCFQCLDYKFEHELSIVKDTEHLVCQDCLEGLLNGSIAVDEGY